MADIDVNRIENIIADIQTAQSAVDACQKEISRLEIELDNEKEQLEDEQSTVRSLRDELDAYLDELIPEDGRVAAENEHHF